MNRRGVGDVGELLGPHLREVRQYLVAQQLRVQGRHAVHLRRSDGGEIGHAHRTLRVLGDDAHAPDAQFVAGERLAHLVAELGVDAVDDLHVARQQASEQVGRPDLEGLGQQRVARVGETLLRDLPRLVPVELAFVDEDAHEFGDGDDGVGVVELEDDALAELAQVKVFGQHLVDVVVQGRSHEEILLLEAQFLALGRGVLGVEHLGDVLGEGLRAHCLGIVARVEDLQVERLGGLGPPQA